MVRVGSHSNSAFIGDEDGTTVSGSGQSGVTLKSVITVGEDNSEPVHKWTQQVSTIQCTLDINRSIWFSSLLKSVSNFKY